MWQVRPSTAQVDLDSTASATSLGSAITHVAVGHVRADHGLDAAEQFLVLEFLVAEADQRLERDLVAQPVIAADLEHLGVDEALHQAEDVGVGAPLDLADQPLLVQWTGSPSR
jgi:hypothetical protein